MAGVFRMYALDIIYVHGSGKKDKMEQQSNSSLIVFPSWCYTIK